MANRPGGSPVDGAAGSDTTSGGGSGDAINAAHLRSRQLSSLLSAKRSSRNASNLYKAHPPTTTRLGIEALGSCERKRKQQLDGASHGISEADKAGDSAPPTPKRKCMPKNKYLSVFKLSSKWQGTALCLLYSNAQYCSLQVKEIPFQKLQRLPDGCHPDFDNDHLCTVNNLREFWHKSHGAFFVDDKVGAMAAHPDAVIEDNIVEYKSLLAFLHSGQDIGDYIDADALAILRTRFKRHIAYERKACSSKFMEYWVPAYLSQAQLKQYSSLLLANSSILQSQTTTANVKALRDIFMSLWKCCNHPCLVGLQHSPVSTHDVNESADDIMHNSGKLVLLDKMLKEIRNKRLRVIVLFQSDGAIGDLMGNILENFIRHRFGSESYERVLDHSAFSIKQEAMNMFNNTTKGRFVFLIDSRACHFSIKLSSVDTIIIYGSDLNPLNDLKALRNIQIDSQLKYVRIFRLYTPFTVEEKGLVLAKQGMIIDSNCQDIMPTLSHCLLGWGVSFLFSRVDELQQDNCASESHERGTVFMDKVILEFLTELSTDIQDSGKVNSTTISKAYMSGECYSRNITLVGESDGVSSLDGEPPKLWLNLLNGKLSCQPYKQNEASTEETNEARKKLRKRGEIAGSSSESSPVTNMPAQNSTGLPAQQNTAISGHPQAEAEPSSNLDMESAHSLHPDIQPSSSILDADGSQTWRQPETAPLISQGGSTYHHLVDDTMGFDVDNNGMVCAHQVHSESPSFAAPQSPEMLPFSLDVGTRANLSSTSPLQSSDVPSSPPPAVAVSPGMLGTELEQDLLPDMAPSTSLSGVPLQRIQTGCRADRATDLSEAGETEYLTCATCNLATLPASKEAETENGQASVPAQEIRTPHAQHNLATSQPLVDDLQPPTSILSEEAEMSSMLCATATQDLQHGMEPSITTHDSRLERTDLSGMPVTLSTTVLQSVEPSRDPHAEQAETLGILSARDSRPEVQPSSPMQDQPAEVEVAGTSGTIAAQTLQSETQSSTSVQYNPPERTHPDELELWKTGLSKNLEQKVACSNCETFCVFLLCATICGQKSKVAAECNQENEKIKKKFELILQKEDQAYHQSKKYIDDAYMKVLLQQSMAENSGVKFEKSVPAQGTHYQYNFVFHNDVLRSLLALYANPSDQVSLLVFVLFARLSLAPQSLAACPPGLKSLYSAGPFLQPSQVPRASASEVVQPQPVLPGSLYRATPSPASPMALRYGSYGRRPAPHLRQLRMPAASAVALGDQQQLASMSPGIITSSRQSAPVKCHTFLQSPSTVPVAIAGQQASGLIPCFRRVPGGSLNGVAGLAQARDHLGGMNQAAPEPTQETLLLLQRQWFHALAPSSSVQQPVASASASPSPSKPHPGLLASSANRYLM
ncbi:hypothetical protein HU200_043751 [Digitaria exilis]|uniref:Uncharacterized protein n=1 Tax=Digitaria exilis TaxID=1010633 RepID=A0A835B3M4_9POAL|nr:hypothetical protein HU200_043751 [Digitaria exilis]